MRKYLFAIAIGVFLAAPAVAGELEEKKLQLQNIQLEFQLLQTRQQVLQFQAKELQAVISQLEEKVKTDKKAEEKQ